MYQRFQTVENLFKYPTKSKNVGIYKTSGVGFSSDAALRFASFSQYF